MLCGERKERKTEEKGNVKGEEQNKTVWRSSRGFLASPGPHDLGAATKVLVSPAQTAPSGM